MALATVTNIKEKARENFSAPVFWSVIAASVAIGGSIYALRKFGLRKAAATVSKVTK